MNLQNSRCNGKDSTFPSIWSWYTRNPDNSALKQIDPNSSSFQYVNAVAGTRDKIWTSQETLEIVRIPGSVIHQSIIIAAHKIGLLTT